MFYEKLKAEAFAEYETALSKYNSLCDTADKLCAQIESKFTEASYVIKEISGILNTITNTPREIGADIGTIAHQIETFKGIDYYRETLLGTYIEAFGDVLRGVSSTWTFFRSGDRIDKWFGRAILALRIGYGGLRISAKNKAKAIEAHRETKRIKEKTNELTIFMKKAEESLHSAETLHAKLQGNLGACSKLRNADYSRLSSQEIRWLQKTVNNTLTLSTLINQGINNQ